MFSSQTGHSHRAGLHVRRLADERKGGRHSAGLEMVLSEPIDVRRLIRTESCQDLVGDPLAMCFQKVNRLRHRNEVVEGQDVSNQVVVFYELALFIPNILSDHIVATKRYPLHELVKSFALVRGDLNGLPQL